MPRRYRIVLLCVIALVASLTSAADATARWAPGLVFRAPATLGPMDGGVFVDRSGNVRWAGTGERPTRALWRSRSHSGHVSAVEVLRSRYPTVAVNNEGAGLVVATLGDGRIVARRRSPLGRYVTLERQISPPGSTLVGAGGAGIDDRGNSVVLYTTKSGIYARRMSSRGVLGSAQFIAGRPGPGLNTGQLAVAPSGRAAVLFTDVRNVDQHIESTIKVVTAAPNQRFGQPRIVSSYIDPGVDAQPTIPRQLDLAISSKGAVAVSWIQGGSLIEGLSDFAQGDVYVATAHPHAPFVVQALSKGHAPDNVPSVAFSRLGSAMVTWAEAGPNETGQGLQQFTYAARTIHAAYSLHGDIFGVHRQLRSLSAGQSLFRPKVAFDSHGDAAVVWEQGTQTGRIVASLRDRGHDFASPRDLGTGSYAEIAGGGRGVIAVTWTQVLRSTSGNVRTSIFLP